MSDNELNETLFHTANGYIGVRGALEEGVNSDWNTMRGTYINGFYDVIPMKQAENLCNFVDKKDTMLNVADTMTIRLYIDGEAFDMCTGKLEEHKRTLNMDEGYSLREVIWVSPKGKKIKITSKRMTSFEMLSLFTIEYSVTLLDSDAEIEIVSSHNADVTNYCNPNDPRLAQECNKNLEVIDMYIENTTSVEVSRTMVSNLNVCSACSHEIVCSNGMQASEKIIKNGNCVNHEFHAGLKTQDTITVRKYCVYTDSLRENNVANAAKSYLETAMEKGVEYYYKKQAEYLYDFWKSSNMQIDGDEALNTAVAFNMYELVSSAAKDKYCSIAAKGMSGEGYEGHYFWDTEIFVLPFFVLTNPNLAKMILNYRYHTLDKARENARLLGHRNGALFPWRTITGAECSGYFVSGTAAYHINADIAYAIISYYLTTGDIDFILETGEEILIETSRLWMDLGNYNSQGQFVLNDVTGPDEYTCMVNNNYYTNCAAKYNLQWTVKLYNKLSEEGKSLELTKKLSITKEELAAMSEAAEKMFLPFDETLGINPQDDSFLDKPMWDFKNTPKSDYPLLLHYHPLHLYRYQVCKQADTVLAHFMFEEMQSIDVMKKSYEYYEKITTHDSSLSTCVFSIVASRLGMSDKGYEYFGDSAKLDLENRHNNTKDGIHTANMGGCYMAVVNGFAGLRIREDGLFLAPLLPDKWDGYCFNIVYMGRLLEVSINPASVDVTLLDGDDIEVNVYGKSYKLDHNGISVKLKKNRIAVVGA